MSATKKEVELELQLWRERAEAVQIGVQSLNLQAQLFNVKSKECQDNIARLEAEYATFGEATSTKSTTVIDAGGGPGEEQ